MAIEFDVVTGLISPIEYGATFDGTTDDTSAVVAALAAAKATTSEKGLLFTGTCKFDPTGIDWGDVPLYVEGILKPTTTITGNTGFTLIGMGGVRSGPQFYRGGNCCEIIAPSGNIPVIKVIGDNAHMIKNVVIYDCRIGIKADGTPEIGANLVMDNVHVQTTQADSYPMWFEGWFWGEITNCTFLTNGNVTSNSILITTSAGLATGSYSGILFFEHCITGGRGWKITNQSGVIASGNINFYDCVHQSAFVDTGEYWIDIGQPWVSSIHGVSFDSCAQSDGGSRAYCDYRVSGFQYKNGPQLTWDSNGCPPGQFDWLTGGPFTLNGSDLGYSRTDKYIYHYGDVDTRLIPRATAGEATLALGTGVALTPQATSGITYTTGYAAPDGSSTAILVDNADATPRSPLLANANIAFTGAGDILVISGWIRASNVTTGNIRNPIVASLGVAAGMAFVTGDSNVDSNGNLTAVQDTFRVAYSGWQPFYAYAVMSGTPSGTSRVDMNLVVLNDVVVWKLSYRVIPAALAIDKTTFLRYMNSIGTPAPSLKSGVVGLQDHQTFRAGVSTTANLPTAASVGAGAMIYDSTRGFYVVSDGSIWRNMTGSIV